jgi:hypothetical protein
MAEYKQTFTLTFGDRAENHKGMQIIGNLAEKGFTKEELVNVRQWFREKGAITRMIKLHNYLPDNINRENNKAYVLIIKNGVNIMLDNMNGSDMLYNEIDVLPKDTKALMYGRVVNKHARHNLCFGEEAQAPDYINGKGTVVALDTVPLTKRIQETFGTILESASDLMVEGNFYYDTTTCGIGWHGDAERLKVVGVRLGATIPLVYCWFHNNTNITEVINMPSLEHGDIYMMSEKATGFDWKKKTQYTLRHAAGAKKYITL